MYWFPPVPQVPPSDCAEGPVHLRYEDVSQTGYPILTGMPHAVGTVVWLPLVHTHPITTVGRDQDGILPILTRLIVESCDGPIALGDRLHGTGAIQLARSNPEPGQSSRPTRLYLNMWTEIHGEVGITHGPAPERAGEEILVGRIFGEHVLSRPFVPQAKRRVTRLDLPGLPEMPETAYEAVEPLAGIGLGKSAAPLDREITPNESTIVFGLGHTDSNRHVNSQVYLRIFEAAALERFATLGLPCNVIGRYCNLAFRKPFFSGDRVRAHLQAFRLDAPLGPEVGTPGSGLATASGDGAPAYPIGTLGVVGYLLPVAETPTAAGTAAPMAPAHCYATMLFTE